MNAILPATALALTLAACNQAEPAATEPAAETAAVAPTTGEEVQQGMGGPRDPFQRLDTNADNVLSAEEIAAASERGKAMLERADTDKDGRVTRAEIEASMAAMVDRFDKNGDGVISEDERPFRRSE